MPILYSNVEFRYSNFATLIDSFNQNSKNYMGLFSFLKNTGSKIFTGKSIEERRAEAEAEARKEQITLLNSVIGGLSLPIENMDIDINEDTVTVYGQVESQEAREKVILALGNVEGVATVDDRISVTTPAPEAVFYEVQSGDSLSKISKAHYGDPMRYNEIFEANKPMLDHPDKIYPGQVLRIPNMNA